MSIVFDLDKLEFVGIGEGNVFVTDETDEGKLPEWSFDVDKSNEIGKINIMYLDISGGKYSFSDTLLNDEENVLVQLVFKLKGSVITGDICEFTIEDAVFAA